MVNFSIESVTIAEIAKESFGIDDSVGSGVLNVELRLSYSPT
jgi:hypothetical protein